MNLNFVPKQDIIIARILDMNKTESGLVLPDQTELKGMSIFALVEKVGPKVENCKPGDVVLPLVVGHCWLRAGFYRALIKDINVLAVVEGLDPELFVFANEPSQRNGSRLAVPSSPALR